MSYDPKQPRVPAGNAAGGQWTDGENMSYQIVKAARKGAGLGSLTSKEFIQQVNERPDTMINFIDPRNTAFLTEEGDDIRAQVEMQVRDDPYTDEPRVYFNIIVPEHQRRKGFATMVIKDLMQMADQTGVTLFGQPGNFGYGEKMTDPQLWKWYLRLGFKKKGGQVFYRPKK